MFVGIIYIYTYIYFRNIYLYLYVAILFLTVAIGQVGIYCSAAPCLPLATFPGGDYSAEGGGGWAGIVYRLGLTEPCIFIIYMCVVFTGT